mmetsp:Transcript_732/g.1813  ORF Transcript_732/g.1813 Transcript_732/m.1813 type:complete len:203 (+) Transcript_732:483-1091(+)
MKCCERSPRNGRSPSSKLATAPLACLRLLPPYWSSSNSKSSSPAKMRDLPPLPRARRADVDAERAADLAAECVDPAVPGLDAENEGGAGSGGGACVAEEGSVPAGVGAVARGCSGCNPCERSRPCTKAHTMLTSSSMSSARSSRSIHPAIYLKEYSGPSPPGPAPHRRRAALGWRPPAAAAAAAATRLPLAAPAGCAYNPRS